MLARDRLPESSTNLFCRLALSSSLRGDCACLVAALTTKVVSNCSSLWDREALPSLQVDNLTHLDALRILGFVVELNWFASLMESEQEVVDELQQLRWGVGVGVAV